MSDDRRKMNKQGTGTVPKIKCRNNSSYERDSPRSSWTNNLATDLHRLNLSEYLRNSRRNLPNYCAMSTVEEQRHLNPTVNGSVTPNTSSSAASRRNSSGTVPKCDNITKCPDKKQIEDKLTQIREYLQITTSLMSSMKNTDDQSNDAAERNNLAQMINDLKDSESKLVNILKSIEEGEADSLLEKNEQLDSNDNYSEAAASNSHRNDFEELRDHQLTMLALQQKAENKLKDARQIQDKLLMAQYGNDLNSAVNQRDKNLTSIQDFDAAIRELEERTKRLNEPRAQAVLQDKLLAEVDSLQNQIVSLHNINEDRTQLIQVLDNRDTELRAQHVELQSKLTELQTKKQQIDQLVAQLQNMESADDDDVGTQVRRIVTMKEQLSKLKDMLEIVKTTENVIQNSNGGQEEQDLACGICAKAENFLQKDAEKRRTTPVSQHESNVALRYDNTGTLNEARHKQMNKNANSYDRQQQQGGYGGAKPKSTSNKLALQAELEAKKRELEEIMGKHKAGTSNLNHDVGTDNKSEFSCSSNAFFDGGPAWVPIMADHNRFDSSESDECPEDINEYSELNSHHGQPNFSLPVLNYPRSKMEKSDHGTDYSHHLQDNDRRSSIPRTPERNVRSNSAAGSRERARSNSQQSGGGGGGGGGSSGGGKNQVQKQLELIRSVCDSMLEQQQEQQQHQQMANVQQLRNNLTPSSLYSVNPLMESSWPTQTDPSSNYQGWLATNTLQTQAFMLNTLNQCCQMLWLQQRELIALRQAVGQLQERLDNSHLDQGGGGNQSHLASPMQPNPGEAGGGRRLSNQKANQVAAACSMPNLNQYNIPSVNLDPASYHHHHHHHQQNNMQNAPGARLLDPCLNNANMNLNPISTGGGEHINNSVLHAVNANINQMPGQMWNGQALNNQVAPGNRANNYWDNFRSYSRQNLLSTKSNEGLQNNPNPFALMSLSKSNSDHTSSANASQENTPGHRRAQFVRNSDAAASRNNTAAAVPPDVLNVNHNVNKSNDLSLELSTASNQQRVNANDNDSNLCYHYHLNNAFAYNNEISSNNSNVSEEQQIFKDCVAAENASRRNEWHEDQNEEPHPKSKLFEELRENVYKEVVTLISANETRPHFLIQLFRDLQMISSDPLRLKILQSIQTIITHSLVSSNRQVAEQPQQNEQLIPDGGFSLQSTVWSKSLKNPAVTSRNTLHLENETAEMQSVIKEIIPYLNDHEDDVIGHPFLVTLKQVLIESESFQEAVRDSVFKKHFSNVLDEVLTQYHGKKVKDVKMHVIQTVNDLLRGELSFIQLIQDTCPDNCDTGELMFETANGVMNGGPGGDGNGAQIQNGDLAEADQGRVEEDDLEEEGAVGGFWDLQLESPVVVNAEEADIAAAAAVTATAIEFTNSTESQTQFIKQGLDQVPTRLPTKSRSNTPSKERSTSSRSDHPEQF